MSFLLKGKKEDLLELATELGLQTTVDMTKPMLKNLITKSAGYDEEDTKLMYEEVQTFFNGWIEGLDIKTFDKLRELMIADQMKKIAPVEFKERHLDEWPSINCPVELAERLQEFEDVRRTLKQKTHTLTPVRRPEVRGSNQVENLRKFDNHNTRRTGNLNPEKRHLDTPPSRDFDRRAPRRYVTYVIP
ncbi:retrovirus-related Pol polyprotein from transposon 17.6 [Trichonephila clavipes]|nr:retrovirus-related Pol polyprotein from transposon 17.6 [Trichonephila clavipes]